MSEKYKIFVEREAGNHVKIFKAKENKYGNYWNFSLINDNEPLIINEFYTDTRFIIVNGNGWIKAFDADTKEIILDHNLNGQRYSKAVFSLDKTKLYVAFTQGNSYLATIDLDTLKVTVVELPDDIYMDTLQIRKDGNLIFYKIDSQYQFPINKEEKFEVIAIFKHFYSVLDLSTTTMEKFELPLAPQFEDENFFPVIDLVNNKAILPAYEDVLLKADDNGETLFEFRIQFLDLNTFESTILSVRDFTKNQLGCSDLDDKGEDEAKKITALERNEDYYDAIRDFYENLTTIKVVDDGIWLCWHGGVLRKINSQHILSPLLVTSSLPKSINRGMFNYKSFRSELFAIDNSNIVLEEYSTNYYKTKMPDFNSQNIGIPIALEFTQITLDEWYQLSYSTENKQEIEERDYIKIEVNDLSVKESFTQALLQIQNIVSDLNGTNRGTILKFIIKDAQGKTLHEPEFFEEAITHAPELIQSIIQTLLQYPEIAYSYRNEKETVLCHAVLELAKQGNQFITTVFQYLDAIDLDHDVFNVENLFPLLEEKYTSKEELIKKMKAVSEDLAEWYDSYC